LVSILPSLKKKYLKYESYKGQTVEDIFTKEQLKQAVKLEAYMMQSSVLINSGKGTFAVKALPAEAQFSPMYGIAIDDFDKDGNADIVMGGNFYHSKPEVGIYDASYGVFLKGNGKGDFKALNSQASGFNVRGAIRSIDQLKAGQSKIVVVSLNNGGTKVFNLSKKNKG
ncbi:MAG: hypothetical protein JWQ40_4316, partial [Segetibacter sp.]|nr:hypothetical protein [Segetibacter sp.]